MALTRKFLTAMGIEADKVDEIIEAHAQTVNGLKDKIADYEAYKDDAGKLADVQTELDELKKQIAKDAPYKQKFEDEQKAFADFKKGIEAKETIAKKQSAYKALMKDARIGEKYVATILKVTDMSGVELDDEGNIKNAEDLKKKVIEEYPEFVEKEGQKGADPSTPPGNNGGKEVSERAKHAAEIQRKYNAKLYGEMKKED